MTIPKIIRDSSNISFQIIAVQNETRAILPPEQWRAQLINLVRLIVRQNQWSNYLNYQNRTISWQIPDERVYCLKWYWILMKNITSIVYISQKYEKTRLLCNLKAHSSYLEIMGQISRSHKSSLAATAEPKGSCTRIQTLSCVSSLWRNIHTVN